MRGPEQLFESEDHWVTSMGAWFPGERVVLRGKDLFHDLKDLSWMALLLFGITGRIPDERQVRLFEGIWALSTSFPEPRLWNNRVAALAVELICINYLTSNLIKRRLQTEDVPDRAKIDRLR